MVYKIYLAPSNQKDNVYYGGKTTEAKECRAIANLVATNLKKHDILVKVGKATQSLWQQAQEANSWGADAYVAIHSNGYKGETRGCEVWYYTGSKNGKDLAQSIYTPLEKLVGNGRKLKNTTDLQDLKNPKMKSVIVEIAFHDNKLDAQYIVSHHKELATAISDGILDDAGLKKTESKPKPVSTVKDCNFKVQTIVQNLNVREGAGTNHKVVGTAKKGVYTIIKTDGNWGYLKSKMGWINISAKYCKRI